MLDAPVSGGILAAEAGSLTFMVIFFLLTYYCFICKGCCLFYSLGKVAFIGFVICLLNLVLVVP